MKMIRKLKSAYGFVRLLCWGLYHINDVRRIGAKMEACEDCRTNGYDLCDQHEAELNTIAQEPVIGDSYE